MQRRSNGKVSFYRDWADYAKGFVDNDAGEMWIGLDFVNKMTTAVSCGLLVEMMDVDGASYVAEYTNFQVGSEAAAFPLTVSGYSGTAGDSLGPLSGNLFSTRDRDNNPTSDANDAVTLEGAWWFDGNAISNLNGVYQDSGSPPDQGAGLYWQTAGEKSMLSTRMTIKRQSAAGDEPTTLSSAREREAGDGDADAATVAVTQQSLSSLAAQQALIDIDAIMPILSLPDE
ncbi:angiopoietin-4-like [Diadema setosum]|uniref:angiopoietin-4-like n=1 Tax=Diadema setosum TaxID=31175 RepID=UPI003B3B28CA